MALHWTITLLGLVLYEVWFFFAYVTNILYRADEQRLRIGRPLGLSSQKHSHFNPTSHTKPSRTHSRRT